VKENRHFPRSAWFIVAGALLFLSGSVAQIAYRFTLPTDGWLVYTTDVEGSSWYYYANLVGADSGLQQYDAILAVDGRSVSETATSQYVPPPPNWRVGQTVTMLIQRGSDRIEVAVPVVHWTGEALWCNSTVEPSNLSEIVGAMLLVAIGWFTFLRRPAVPGARALLFLGTAFASVAISSMLPDGLSVQFNRTAFYLNAFFSYVVFVTVLAPSLLAFALLFPKPKGAVQRRPWLALLPYAYGLLVLLVLLLGGSGEIGWFSTLGMLLLAVVSFIHATQVEQDPVARAQLRWAVSSFVAGIVLFSFNFPLGFGLIKSQFWVDLVSVLASLGFVVIGTGLAVAVLRFRLYDIDVIIRKTLIYAILSALLGLVYFGSVLLLQNFVGGATNEQSPLIIVISTLMIAALFSSLRKRVQAFIDGRFYRRKVNAQQVLAEFAQTARDEVSLEALTAEVTRVVQETMQPENMSLWLAARHGEKP